MKRILLFAAALCACGTAAADEGMWLLPYLQKMNIADMRDKGCRLKAEDIYRIDGSSLKDAIVVFGRGCTGEIVSPEGLVFTNHHCGYGSIQALSSVDHDYLKNGFWAMNNAEELPVPGLEIRFVRRILDVTPDLLGNVPNIAGEAERARIVEENTRALTERLEAEHEGMEIQVKSFFGGNRYFAFVMEVFKDIRLVGAPPSSIGKFGGDTDNWMWPRHTGDFSIFRVYASPDNRPAAYSPENVPYRAEKYLKVSLDGYKEGDFAMIMGFPGSTQRYMTSYEIDKMLEVDNPQRIFIRGERQRILREDMDASDKVRIQYASKYAQSSNYWKNSIGMSRGIGKLNVKAKKEAEERAFTAWAEAETLPGERFREALPMIREACAALTALDAERQWLSEGFLQAVELLTPARYFLDKTEIEDPETRRTKFREWYEDFNPETDRKVAKRMLALAREHMKRLPDCYAVIDRDFGGDIDAYVDWVYDRSRFTSIEGVEALLDDFSHEKAEADPAMPLARAVWERYTELGEQRKPLAEKFDEGHRLYIAGLMRMQPDKAWASDANSTIRLTYGQVLPYDPVDGVHYNYWTTLRGVMEKENPENREFVVPARLKELYAAGDFGRYADEDGTLHVAFLANCDITGGNSGSPMMNARGELIGLAFDGNWEAMSGDVAFEPELQRTIVVDARYVLFVIDKFAGAGWLLDEMELVQQPRKKGRR